MAHSQMTMVTATSPFSGSSQVDLSGAKVAGMANAMQAANNEPGDVQMNEVQVGLTSGDLLHEANRFVEEMGLPRSGIALRRGPRRSRPRSEG
jgi:hypothetical protein